MKSKYILFLALATPTAIIAPALTPEPIKYGNMDQWVTRNIKESSVIGGNEKTLYEVGPTSVVNGNKPYVSRTSPWATSNVYAKVHGITKGTCSVSPAVHPGHGKCARLSTKMESVKVLGIINMDVMVAGSMFLGQIHEPITSTKSPYSKMDMGIPFTKRPLALVMDYKLDMPAGGKRVKSSGFGSKKTLPGRDNAIVFVHLQRRWEDADGNIHAKRVATGGEKFSRTTPWTEGHQVKLVYGDASKAPGYIPEIMALRDGDNAYYARNSRGQMVKIREEGWDNATAAPTHVIVMISSGDGEPYVGTEGTEFFVDNLAFAY